MCGVLIFFCTHYEKLMRKHSGVIRYYANKLGHIENVKYLLGPSNSLLRRYLENFSILLYIFHRIQYD